jgi:Domain of unknown function (DUF4384)
MKLPKYEDHEPRFLEAMATRFCFSGKNRIIFIERFREKNADSNNKTIAECYQVELLEGTKNGVSGTIFTQQLSTICDKLAEEGCDFNGDTNGKGRWKIAKRWLREVIFPQWAKEQGLVVDAPATLHPWEQLLKLATPTDKMGPKLAGVLDMGSPYEECLPLGSNIIFEVKLETPGYLLLLEKGTSGRFWCLCPSVFAPQPFLGAGVAVLPQPVSGKKSFKITGEVGLEQLVAVIGKDKPSLDWLPEGSENPLQLQEGHLNELLKFLERSGDCKVFYMEYTVTK